MADNTDNDESTQKTIKFGCSKYKNIMGITCYMNSILHILQHVPVFMTYITQAKFRETLIEKIELEIQTKKLIDSPQTREELIKKSVIFELFRLFKTSFENDDAVLTPTSFKKTIGDKNDMWNEYNHQDSQEFFTFLISQLEEENGKKSIYIPGLITDITDLMKPYETFQDTIHNINAKISWNQFQMKEYSLFKNIFDGLQETTRICKCCETMSTRYEPFVTLGLSIPINDKGDIHKSYDIYECLDHMIQLEQLDSDNKLNCDMCGIKNRGMTKTILWKTPKLLVLHIKRFLTNSIGIQTQKLNNNIDYPIYNLDLSNYFNPSSPYKSSSKYDLIGVNIHHSFGRGNGMNFGHYTSIIKNVLNNNWYHYNDSSPVRTLYTKQNLQNPDAYLLFYYRHD